MLQSATRLKSRYKNGVLSSSRQAFGLQPSAIKQEQHSERARSGIVTADTLEIPSLQEGLLKL